jgi:phage FluMu protein Com
MPVKVRCTNCDKVLAAPDAARGKAIKCPSCQERIAVPEEDSSSGSMKAQGQDGNGKVKKKPAKSSKPADSEDALASFDLTRAEDANARVCNKCGHDMQYQDEEDTECPKCGYDSNLGGQGKKAQKKAMRGPDPADFYPGLAKNCWKFVLKNSNLAWRTAVYVTVCLLISMICGFMYLWLSQVPPRAFFVLCFTVSFMVIPGWMWLLDDEVIKLTLERKDKFKRINFDFFLASAMGIMFLGWLVVVALPFLIIPVGIGYYMVNYSGSPPWVLGVCTAVGLIPAIWMFPVSMSHMVMPVSTPGWMVWKVVPAWLKTIKALSVWMMWLFLTTLPITGGIAAVGAVWGNDITRIVTTMEANARTHRERFAAANAPKGKNAPAAADPSTIGTIVDLDFKPLIAPAIVMLVLCIPVGFIAMFNMRINGEFTYYHKNRLGLIDKKKEYKYVSKTVVGEDGEVIQTADTSG